MKHSIEKRLKAYERYLIEEERSPATVEKYTHIVRGFFEYAEEAAQERTPHIRDRNISKEKICAYKRHLLEEGDAPQTINAKLSAIRSYLRSIGREDIHIKNVKVQRSAYVSEKKMLEKSEYERLLRKARETGQKRICLILETICSCGIRVSELEYVTKEAVDRGEAQINLKGKVRKILMPGKLRKKLRRYAAANRIYEGPLFTNGKGSPIHRSYVWQMMKRLARKSGVDERKVFPHNLRRLFARSFYKAGKDISKLADVLGHSSIDTTRIYIATPAREHERVLERLQLVT